MNRVDWSDPNNKPFLIVQSRLALFYTAARHVYLLIDIVDVIPIFVYYTRNVGLLS